MERKKELVALLEKKRAEKKTTVASGSYIKDKSQLVAALERKRKVVAPDKSKVLESEKSRVYKSVIPDKYKQYLDAEDYAEKSTENLYADIGNDLAALGGHTTHSEDEGRYNYINANNGFERFTSTALTRNYLGNIGKYDYINDDEKAMFNYLYNTGNKDEAYSYLDSIEDALISRQDYEAGKRYETESDLALSAKSVYHQLVGGAEGIYNLIGEGADLISGEDNHKVQDYHTRKAQAMRAYASADMSATGQFFYNTGMSMVDSAVAMLLGAAAGSVVGGASKIAHGVSQATSLITMGSQAAAVTASEAKERGLSSEETFLLSLIAGGTEAATEFLPLDKLFKTVGSKALFKDGLKGVLKSVGKQAITEAREEGISETVNILADFLVTGDKSNVVKAYNAYINEGKSKSEAIGLSLLDNLKQIGLSSLGGFVSGVGFGSAGAGINSVVTKKAYTKVGNDIINVRNAANELLEAAEVSPDKDVQSLAKKARSAYESDPASKKSLQLVGEVAFAVEKEISLANEKMKKILEGKKIKPEEKEKLKAEIEERNTSEYGEKVAAYEAQLRMSQAVALTSVKYANEAKENATPMPSRIKYNKATSEIYERGRSEYKGDDASYSLGFELARNLGLKAEGRSLAEMINTLSERDKRALLALSDTVINGAFDSGVAETERIMKRQAEIDKASAENKGGNEDKNGSFKISDSVKEKKLTRAQKEDIKKIELLSSALDSVNILIEDLGYEGENGYYDPKSNTIVININAGRETEISPFDFALSQAMSHETVHFIEKHAPKEYARLERFVVEHFFKGHSLDYAVKLRRNQYISYKANLLVKEAKENGETLTLEQATERISAEFGYSQAKSEVIANALEDMLDNPALLKELAVKEKSLFKRLWQSVMDFFDKLFSGWKKQSFSTMEGTLVKEATKQEQKELNTLFANALRSANEAAKTRGSESIEGERLYSFAGVRARTADVQRLENAQKMLEDGADAEKVRKETGWFKSYDGKWRFEISDADSYLIETPSLEKHTEDGEVYFTGKLSDIFNHEELFAAYPDLKDINIVIQKTEFGVDGIYQPNSNYITLSIEQFKRPTKSYYDYLNGGRKSEIDRIEASDAYREYNRLYDDSVMEEMEPTEWLEAEAKAREKFYSSELGKRYYQLMWGKSGFVGDKFEFGWAKTAKETLLHELQHAVQKIEGFASGTNTRDKNYDLNAGEIEARDTARRANMTAEERKNIRPDIDRLDVVVAKDSNVSYFSKDQKSDEAESIRIQMLNHLDEINKMEPVASINYDYVSKEKARKDALELYKTKGFKIDRQNFGVIELGEKEIKDSDSYVNTSAEAATWMTIPNVLKRGKLISGHANHKNEGFPTYTIAAPVIINGKPGNVGITVKKTGKYRYKAHRIITPEGSVYIFSNHKENAEPTASDILIKNEKGPDISSASIYSIPETEQKSNSFSEKSSEKFSKEQIQSLSGYGSMEKLAEAFAEIAESEEERLCVKRYKEKLQKIKTLEDEAADAESELLKLPDADYAGKEKTVARLKGIINSRRDIIHRESARLLNLKNASPLRELVEYREALIRDEIMTRYGIKVDREEGESTQSGKSKGAQKKMIANYTHDKVFSRSDASKTVADMPGAWYLSGKDKREFIDELWQGLNEYTTRPEREAFAGEMSRKIFDRIYKVARDENPDAEIYRQRISYLKSGIQRLYFSESEKEELIHILDKDGYRSFIARWGYKGKGLKRSADEFFTDVLRDMSADGINLDLDPNNYIDGLVELDRLYENAKEALDIEGEINVFLDMESTEISEFISAIKGDILEAYAEKGKKSKFSRAVDERIDYYQMRAEKMKTQLQEVKGRDKILGSLVWKAIKMRELKLGDYTNATQAENKSLKLAISKLSRIQFRANFSETQAKSALHDLSLWYSRDNKMLYSEEYAKNCPDLNYYDETIAGAIKYLEGREGTFDNDDLVLLGEIMDYLINFVKTYNKVYIDGQWLDAVELARAFKKAFENRMKKESRGFRKFAEGYLESFADPHTVARYMDGYDVYAEDGEQGFFSFVLDKLTRGTLDAAVEEMKLLKDYNAFLTRKENHRFLQRELKETVDYKGAKIPRLNLVQLYMTAKRRHAWNALVLNGFVYGKGEDKASVPGRIPYNTEVTEELIKAEITEMQSELDSLLTSEEKEYISIMERIYNLEAKELKRKGDEQLRGYATVIDDYYVPIHRDGIARSVDTSIVAEMAKVNYSFNKHTVEGSKQPLVIEDADAVFRRHVKGVTQYYHLQPSIEMYDRIFNVDCSDNPNNPDNIKNISEKFWSKGFDYFKKLTADIRGVSKKRDGILDWFDKGMSKLQSGVVKFQLAFNPKVWASQLSSLFASYNIIDAECLVKATKMKKSEKADVDTYCEYAMLRNSEQTIAKAQGMVTEKVNAFSDLLMKPIGAVDRAVIVHLFGACQYQVEKDKGLAVGSEENKVEAGKLLERVILETQQNAIMTERSAAMRSDNPIIRTLTLFSADAVKSLGRFIDGIGEYFTLRKKLAHTENAEQREKIKAKMRVAKKKVKKATASLFMTSIYMSLIALAVKALRGKLPEEPEDVLLDLGADFAGNMIGGLPMLRDVYSLLAQGYEIDNFTYSAVNDLLGSVRGVITLLVKAVSGEADGKDVSRALKSLAYAIGQMTGIPVRNFYNFIRTAIRQFSPEAVENMDKYF